MGENSGDPIALTEEELQRIQKRSLIRIVDDDISVLRSYEFMLRTAGWRSLTYESAECFLSSRESAPGCLILDVRMPGLSGLELQQKLEILERDIPIIFVTGHGDVDMAVQTLRRGAKDFLLKPVDPKRLKASVLECCLADVRRYDKVRENLALRRKVESLSEREREVADLLSQGLIYKQISDVLGCSERTVKFHKSRIAEKLGVKTVAEIIMKIK